jgi:hypothetical protein
MVVGEKHDSIIIISLAANGPKQPLDVSEPPVDKRVFFLQSLPIPRLNVIIFYRIP